MCSSMRLLEVPVVDVGGKVEAAYDDVSIFLVFDAA